MFLQIECVDFVSTKQDFLEAFDIVTATLD